VSTNVNFEEVFASRKYHHPIPVMEDEEHEAPKFELRSPVKYREVQKPLGAGEMNLSPSISIKRPGWFIEILRDS
jgi:hypothetical protein